MGMQITAERLALLNMENEQPAFFNIEDIVDAEGKTGWHKSNIKNEL